MKIILSFLCLLFLFGCENSYVEHHRTSHQQTDLSASGSSFDLGKLESLSGVELVATPSLKMLERMVSSIDQAQTRVRVEVYILTEKRIQKALKRAQERGIDVKVVLEKNVYMAPALNATSSKYLKNASIPVVWSNAQNYALNHSKMMIVDETAYVSTGNYSYSSFSENREFFLIINHPGVLEVLSGVFLADFGSQKYCVEAEYLILSPCNTRVKFDALLQSSTQSIRMYSLNMADSMVVETLLKKASQGVNVSIIFPSNEKVDANTAIIKALVDGGVKISQVKTPSIHAKAILVDEKVLYIGSVNFSTESIEQNREIGFLFTNQEIITHFLKIFGNDFP